MSRGRRALLLLSLAVLAVLGWTLLQQPRVKNWIKARVPHPFDRADTLSERDAIVLFNLAEVGDQHRYDPVAYLLPRPDQESVWAWPEHAAGELLLRTNDVGMNEDAPLAELGRGPRVLVAGDSHTAGLVPNHESFANVAEALLRAEPGLAGVEVLNAGVGFTGPGCYLGVLRKYLDLEPAVFVATLFSGNDFADDLRLRYALDGWSLPRGTKPYYRRLRAGVERFPEAVFQGFNQVYRWRHFPDERERSLEAVLASYRAMQALCDEHGIAFLALVLPTKMDVDGDDDLERREGLRELLELTPEDVAASRRLTERLVAALRADGIRCLDPTEAMRAHPEPLYWRQDYHLNTAGHALVGELVAEELRELLR